MTTPAADLAAVVLAHIAQDPPRRVGILRPRPRGLPHPWRRLARLQGVVRLPYLPHLTALPGSPAGLAVPSPVPAATCPRCPCNS
jgi:hypothetical protein